MYTLDELKKQNQEISDLCEVLSILMEQTGLHDNPVVCELMNRFKEKVWMHLVFEDNTIYTALASHSDSEVSQIAQEFHNSAKSIKKRFTGFVRNWCHPANDDAQHAQLKHESREIFKQIVDRIQYENEQMFPLVEKYQLHA